MKKKTLCAFALILWFLVFSTFFSLWVERIMVPWVSVTRSVYSKDSMRETLPLDCLAQDEDGNPVLYQTYEGTGWEEGIRVSLTPPQSYMIGPDRIDMEYGGGSFIRYFSKPLEIGKFVNIIKDPQEGPDALLILCPDGLPPLREDCPESYRIMERTDNAMLVSTEESTFPFLPKKACSDLFETDPVSTSKKQAYSLTEFESFTGSVRLLALIPGFALMTFGLWVYSCFLAKNTKRNRRALLINGSLSAASLLCILWILNSVELPSSLLPQSTITDLSHYAKEFGEIFSALENFAASGNQTAITVLQNANRSLTCSLAVLLGVVLLTAGLIAAEAVLLKRTAHGGRHFRQVEE